MACAGGDFVYAATSDGGRRLSDARRLDVQEPGRTTIAIRYRAADSFETDVNGFVSVAFLPQSRKQESLGAPWTGSVYFRNPPVGSYSDEFEIDTGNGAFGSAYHATFGRVSDWTSLCFFAAGADLGPIPTQGARDFYVVGDGLALLGGVARRVSVTGGAFRADWVMRSIDITFAMQTATPAFAAATSRGVSERATARLSFSQSGGISGTLTGPGGSTGRVAGRFFDIGNGAGLVYDLSWPNGDRAFGAIAVERLASS